jgi:hypothetical protein
MKKCPKCGRTSPPALAICPRCKTPFNAQAAGTSDGHQQQSTASDKKTSDTPVGIRTIVTASILVTLVIILAVVLYIKRDQLIAVFTDSGPALPREIVRPGNFNELIGTWSGREINGSSVWTFNFSDGYNVSASGPEGWYRGKAAIHWEIGGEKEGLRVPPGAAVLDIDIEASSALDYVGRTSVGAFSVHGGTNLKLCSGEPGKTKRPESFDPASGIRCFELTRTAVAPLPPSASQQEPQSNTEVPSVQIPAVSESEVAEAREAFKNCIAAYKAGNLDKAREYIASTALSEMESSGMIDTALGMMSGLNIDEFTPTLEGNRMIFRKTEKQRDMSMSMSITMVKEDGKWKFGK